MKAFTSPVLLPTERSPQRTHRLGPGGGRGQTPLPFLLRTTLWSFLLTSGLHLPICAGTCKEISGSGIVLGSRWDPPGLGLPGLSRRVQGRPKVPGRPAPGCPARRDEADASGQILAGRGPGGTARSPPAPCSCPPGSAELASLGLPGLRGRRARTSAGAHQPAAGPERCEERDRASAQCPGWHSPRAPSPLTGPDPRESARSAERPAAAACAGGADGERGGPRQPAPELP